MTTAVEKRKKKLLEKGKKQGLVRRANVREMFLLKGPTDGCQRDG